MENNQQNPSGAKSAAEALSKMKENRQKQTSTNQSTQASKPRIQRNTAPQYNNNSNDDDSGCGWILWFALFFFIGFVICCML